MNYALFLTLLLVYVGVLVLVGRLTAGSGSNQTFFTANRNSNWLLVSFGMIGASLSGVTFISVPGWTADSGWTYMFMVLGYLIGYAVIAFVLLPVYYRYNVVSIYSYLGHKLGTESHKTGSAFFLLSRVVGASARLYVVTMIVQITICNALGIHFIVTALIVLALIALYSANGGMATIVITDTLQTILMLTATAMALYYVSREVLSEEQGLWSYIASNDQFYLVEECSSRAWWKQLLGGASIAIAMTGLDQDMMQKNLTVKSLRGAQKNMILLGIILIFVNALFLSLGILLSDYAEMVGIKETGDEIFAAVATSEHMPSILGAVFFLGLLAAAFSSADSALASLTTAFCIDFLGLKGEGSRRTRNEVYVAFMAVILAIMFGIYQMQEETIISTLFTAAGYTYGPLLGLFALALTTNRTISNWGILAIAIVAPLLSYALSLWAPTLGYTIGFELLLYNGAITYVGAWLISQAPSRS
jgi:Na+/proline symporter